MYPIDISPLFHYSTGVLGKRAQENETCTRVRNPERMEEMKKNLIVLLVIALVSVGLFADPTDSFTVTTSVSSTNNMKVTAEDVNDSDSPAYGSLTDFTDFGVNGTNLNTGEAIAYLTTQSNNRKGYKISIAATAMASTVLSDHDITYINYTVYLGTDTTGLPTTNGTEATKADVVTVSALTTLTEVSYPIKIKVDADQFAAAVDGSYTGTVTFNYVAN